MKQKCPEFENHERWLVSYADMLTLLFAVFVVLFALKKGGEPQVQKAAGAMQESFNTPLEDIPINRQIGPMEQGFGIFDHFKGDQARPPLTKKYQSAKSSIKILNREMEHLKIQLEERLYGPDKFRKSEKPGEARIVEVERTAKGFKLKLLARHFFDSGSVHMKRSALKEIDQIVPLLKELDRDVTIEGHTDSLPPAGDLTNWEISALRATDLLKYLVKEHNFPESHLSAVGYADLRPIAHNGSESGRMLNRRIEIHINYDD